MLAEARKYNGHSRCGPCPLDGLERSRENVDWTLVSEAWDFLQRVPPSSAQPKLNTRAGRSEWQHYVSQETVDALRPIRRAIACTPTPWHGRSPLSSRSANDKYLPEIELNIEGRMPLNCCSISRGCDGEPGERIALRPACPTQVLRDN